jgi:hypothetical protein
VTASSRSGDEVSNLERELEAEREQAAELQGGRAWVEDGEHGGASFRVWLPARSRPS